MQTPLGRSYFQSNARTTVGMWKIGGTDIKNFPIPVPPRKEQQTIVDEVTAARRRAADLRTEAEGLRQQAAAEVEAAILGETPIRK